MNKINKYLGGFTLIELMVVITIILVLSGISVASYYRFSQRQAAVDDARNFATEMRKVQALAKNLVYPPGCAGLISYNLVADCFGINNESCKTMSAIARCRNGDIPFINGENVLSKAFFTYDVDVNFEAGTGRIDNFGTYDFSNSKDPAYTVVVTTDSNGNIDVKEK